MNKSFSSDKSRSKGSQVYNTLILLQNITGRCGVVVNRLTRGRSGFDSRSGGSFSPAIFCSQRVNPRGRRYRGVIFFFFFFFLCSFLPAIFGAQRLNPRGRRNTIIDYVPRWVLLFQRISIWRMKKNNY